MADILRLAGSDVPYTPLLNLTNGMVFITGNNDGVDVSGGSNVTISVSGQGDSAYMRSTNGVTVHDHGDAFHMGIDGAQDLTLLGVQNDPGFLLHIQGYPLPADVGAPTLTADYHGGTLVTFANGGGAIDFVGDRHIGFIAAPSNYPNTPPGYNFFNTSG